MTSEKYFYLNQFGKSVCLISFNQVVCFFLFSEMQTTKCYFEDGFHDTKIYLLQELSAGHTIDGPAIIVDKTRSVTCSRDHVVIFCQLCC